MTAFRFGHAQATDWQGAVAACLDQLGQVPQTGNLGFLYVTDDLADDLGQILDHLRAATGVPHWVGATGIGICATGVEYYQGPALVVMVGEFPAGSFRIFSGPTVFNNNFRIPGNQLMEADIVYMKDPREVRSFTETQIRKAIALAPSVLAVSTIAFTSFLNWKDVAQFRPKPIAATWKACWKK